MGALCASTIACGTFSGLDAYSEGVPDDASADVTGQGTGSFDAGARDATTEPDVGDLASDAGEDAAADVAPGEEDGAADATDNDDDGDAAGGASVDAEAGVVDAAQADAARADAEAGTSGPDAAAEAGPPVCAAGHSDCNGGATCECVTPACCGGSCQTTHSNGVGQSFYDCTGQNTHSQAQAQEACTAFTGSSSACSQSSDNACNCLLILCGPPADSVCGVSGGTCYCWQYSGPNAGKVDTGSASSCKATCGSSGDPGWN